MPRPRSDIQPRILRAARDRFLEQGVDGASLRAIAEDAKTSIGMVYYYFPTKDDLFFAVVEDTYTHLLEGMAVALAPGEPFKTRLLRFFERIAAVSDDELTTIRLVAREVMVSSSRFDRLIARFLRGHIPLVLTAVADGVREGALDAERHPAVMFMATLALATLPQVLRRAAGDRLPFAETVPAGAALSRELVDLLLEGIAARGRAATASRATGEPTEESKAPPRALPTRRNRKS